MIQRHHVRPLSGVRGRVVLTVLVVTACLYSLLGSIGFVYIANSGRNSIRERVANVVDQLEAGLRGGTGTISITTPDGVEAIAVEPGAAPSFPPDDIIVQRIVTIGSNSFELVGHASQARLTESLRSLYRGLWIGVPLGVLVTAVIAGLATRRALRPVSVITDLAASIDAGDTAIGCPCPTPTTRSSTSHAPSTRCSIASQQDEPRSTSSRPMLLTSCARPSWHCRERSSWPSVSPTAPTISFLRRLEALGDRLARRVDDLVLLSTLDEEPPLDLRSIDVLDIVRAEAATMPAGADAPSIEIVGEDVQAMVDERLVSRALRNLMANACRHGRHAVRVEAVVRDGSTWIHVDDDGPGVAAEDREVILRRFGRLDHARDSDLGGAGLGLAIVSSVARAHGGDVVIGDSPLGGARISLRLPTLHDER